MTPTAEQLRDELDTALRKLAESHKMASLGRLSAGIVHEINSPIGSILSNNEVMTRLLERLKGMLETAGAAPKALDIIATLTGLTEVDRLACERISGIVRSLKTFARVSESDLRKVDLNGLITNTIKLTSSLYKRHIHFLCEFAELPEVECYPGLLSQVFLNLVVNAAQAIPDEGTVTVRTAREGNSVTISVHDTGSGIPPEVRPKIFAAGFSTKPIGEGTGLGLTISREIIEDTHGGNISFQSQAGQGTTFFVRIPIQQPRSVPQLSEPQ